MQSDNVKDEPMIQDVSEATPDTGGSTGHFIRSAVEIWVGVVSVPLIFFPRQTRTHLQTAGREFARGVAALAREVADAFDESAQPSK
jgi:hypothetical protein